MNVVREALAKEIARLERVTPGLGERTARYVEDGQPVSVLVELAECEGAPEGLYLGPCEEPGWPQSYHCVDRIDPAATLRYAKCLAAAFAEADWLELFVRHGDTHGTEQAPPGSKLTAAYVERMLAEDGREPAELVATLFAVNAVSGFGPWRVQPFERLQGMDEAVARHPAVAAPHFRAQSTEQRIGTLRLVEKMRPEHLSAFAVDIAARLVDGVADVRFAAMKAARNAGAGMFAPLREIAVQAAASERVMALQALWELGDPQFVRGREAHEKTRGVLDAIAELQARAARRGEAQALTAPELPVIEETPLPAALRPMFDQAIQRINAATKQALLRHASDAPIPGFTPPEYGPISAKEGDALWSYASQGGTCPDIAKHLHWNIGQEVTAELRRFLGGEGIVPLHIVRLHEGLRWPRHENARNDFKEEMSDALDAHYAAHHRPTLVEVEALLGPVGFSPKSIANAYMWLGWGREGLAANWDDADVWPFFARHMDIVREWMTFRFDDNFIHDRNVGFRVMCAFPQPPAEFVDPLFDLAFGTGKADRILAQKALAKLVGKEDRIIAALGDRKGETRAVAADWLRALECGKAVPALEAALRKETNDVAVGAMLTALEALGVDVTKFLDRDGLPKEAAKGLAKGIQSAIEWFPFENLPEVRWGEGQVVPPEVLQWFIVQATKLKSPEPQPLLRRYCAMFEPGDRERFGQFVLDAWLAHDVEKLDPAEAERLARQDTLRAIDPASYYPRVLAEYLQKFKGSSAEAKGALAVAAACAGRGVAAPVSRYLKEYYGTRIHQGKALIGMLAWVEHPAATQLMLSVGHRFRTKQLQEEALQQAEALAERRGWSVSELADRTIPSAGLDENGALELRYGADRTFTAKLAADFKVTLHNAEGKVISSLPEPRKDEDEALAKDAKKAFSAAKKDVKSIVQLQGQRLYEALCTGRTWRFEDWDLYLNRHPIVRRLLQGLVWVELRDGEAARSFRPLDDGTLTDIDDNAVTLDADARVGLAHDTNLDEAAVATWRKHFADYKVAAPFHQLGKGVYVLPAALADETAIPDFRDHVINGLALRGAAGKLGYERGDPEGRAWVFDYRKRFPSLAIEAVVRFSGNDIYDEDVDVELESLSFARIAEGRKGGAPLRLSAVPTVLLSECYNDMRVIAAAGRGIDPDGEKKT